MKQKGTDKRIIKTKMRLKNALILLLQKKKLEDISVVELTELAMINRKTFYLHYQEVPAILLEIENHLSENLFYIIKDYEFSFASLKEFLYNIFNTIMQDEYVVKLLTSTYYMNHIVETLDKVLIESLTKKYKIIKQNCKLKINLMIEYHVYGSLKMFVNWLKDDSKALGFNDFIAFLHLLIFNSITGRAIE